ncbi:XdhC family protein [Streptomyces sp. NPDC057611]|uniref:XdhC family protein n=1 Tax=Streptomyces sp. NPDC057611 TaxID=3346182 RepID=UPI0036962A3A
MRDALPHLVEQLARGEAAALATVVATHGSAPREAGATMLVTTRGDAYGSVSGGCVEGAVYELAQSVLAGGASVLQRYGFSDAEAFEVGLTCGGVLDVFVERIDPEDLAMYERVARDVASGRAVGIATVVRHVEPHWVGKRVLLTTDGSTPGSLGGASFEDAVRREGLARLSSGKSALITLGERGERLRDESAVFLSTFAPPARLIVFGAIDFAAALAAQGALLGYHVTVCDARPVFASRSRFPAVNVVVDWPHRYLSKEVAAGGIDSRTALCVLTHDAKFDVPVLELALRLPEVGYVGAMGSRRTHTDRLQRLKEAGLSPAELARLRSPIGLDLGARTPEETAVSIVAEIIATRAARTGRPLGDLAGPIHADEARAEAGAPGA